MVGVPAGTPAEPAEPLSGDAAGIRVDYYTDPLCCWSWALEPVWRQIRQRRGPALTVRPVLGGMIESWATFRDPVNDVGHPAQLAPLWHLAGRTTGVPIDPSIWHVDPPGSSFPASVGVKAAGLQGRDAEERYLALVREAVMLRRLNVARREVLLDLAGELEVSVRGAFDRARFEADLAGQAALDAFTADVQRARFHRIGRFPTIVAHGPGESRIAVGYRPAGVLEEMLEAVAHPEPPIQHPGA